MTATPMSQTVRLAWLLTPRNSQRKLLAMIASYFDESGIHGGSPITDFAGYVAPASEWERFEATWRVFLANDPVIPYYHAAECLSLKGRTYAAIPKAGRERKHREAVAVICESNILGIGTAVDPVRHKAHSYLMSSGGLATVGAPKSAYDFCFRDVFLALAHYARAVYPGEKVAVVCDQNQELFPQAFDSYHVLCQTPDMAWLSDIFERAPVPGDKKKDVALQAADVLAYEINRELKRETAEPPGARREEWEQLIDHARKQAIGYQGRLLGRYVFNFGPSE
jgi:hypothetical protein